ncbi:MAG: histidine kinase [Ekhidna sp.]
MRLRHLLLSISILFSFSGECQSVNETNYTVKDGLPSNTVYCVRQDSQGFVWFGTDAGLSRFDGAKFKNYGLKEGLPDMEVLNFYEDSFGRIWIYTFNGKVCYIENGKIHNSINTPFLKGADANSRITGIAEKDGIVFISFHKNGIKIIDKSGIIAEEVDESSFIYSYVSVMDDKYCWVEVGDRKLSLITGSVHATNSTRDSLLINDLKVVNTFSYIISSGKDLIGITQSENNHFILRVNTLNKNVVQKEIEDYKIYNLFNTKDQILLFTERGVKKFNKETFEILDFINLPETTNFIEDTEGNSWITTLNNGVYFQPKIELRKHYFDEIFQAKSIFTYQDSSIYIVYQEGKVGLIDQTEELHYLHQIKDKSFLKSMYVDFDRQVWTLNYSGLRQNGVLTKKEFTATNVSYLDDGVFIFQSPNFLIYWNIDTNKRMRLELGKLGKIWDFKKIRDNEFLIASAKGLSVLNIQNETLVFCKAFDNIRITDIELDAFGKLWLSSNGYGLVRIDNSSLATLSFEEVLSNRVDDYSDVFGKILSVDSVIYAATPKGISKMLINESGVLDSYHISRSNGLEPARINDLAYFQNRIYSAQDNGLFSFSHIETFNEMADFPVIVDKVVANDSTYYKQDRMIFTHEISVVQIECKAVNFRNQDNIRYQFRLLDSESSRDQKWNASQSNQFVFSNLSPGNYTFEVRARTVNSAWTKPTAQSFVIKTIFWQTLWFKTVWISSLVLFFILAYLLYTSERRRKKELRRKKIESDLKALKAQINPHFLFNSINSIQSFVLEGNNELAEEYLVKYGKLIRTTLNHSNVLTVSIKEEIEALERYVELEKLRLLKSLNFNIQTSRLDAGSERIPSMIIQPLVENSIWHGIQLGNRTGEITLSFEKVGKSIKVTIEDNGNGFEVQPIMTNNEPSGIQLVRERIDLINKLQGYDSNFEVQSNDEGTRIIFTYPSDLVEL